MRLVKAAAVFARVLFCLALVAGGAVAPAVAQYTEEEIAKIKQKAEQGNVSTQKNLGWLYRYGYGGVEKDGAEAAKWYRLASDQGSENASFALGEMYFNGEGVEKDEAEAVRLFRFALKHGESSAQFWLAKAYEEGRGVEKDEAEAVKRYRLAAEDSGAAQYRLGLMYEEGRGVEQDEVEAFKWFRRADNNENDDAEKKTFEIYRLAAERGDVYAQSKIGYAYYFGNGVEMDKAEAVKWYRRAAEQGDIEAQYFLGFAFAYATGSGVVEDNAEAVRWYRLAAKQGHASAQYRLGEMYWSGRGVEQDEAETLKWWRRAEKQGELFAIDVLGYLYLQGNGVTQNYREAYIRLSYIRPDDHYDIKKAKANLTAAQIKSADEEVQKIRARNQKRYYAKRKAEEEAALEWRRANVVSDLRRKGDAYYKGKGVLPNYKEAAKWYLQAAERGDAEAQYRLGSMYAEGKRGIEQNHVEAYIWLALAGVNDTGEIGDKAASLRESVEKSLTAEQFEQAQAEATERLEKIKAKQ